MSSAQTCHVLGYGLCYSSHDRNRELCHQRCAAAPHIMQQEPMQTVKPRKVWITPGTAITLVVVPLSMGLIQYAQIASQRWQTKLKAPGVHRQALPNTSRTVPGTMARELIPVGHGLPPVVPAQNTEKPAALLRQGHIL